MPFTGPSSALSTSEPAACDARGDEPSIVGPPLAHQQPEPLHPHEEPRDVRLAARHHPVTHLTRGQAVGPRAAEDPEDVVLRLRQAIRLEEVDEILHQRVPGAQHLQEDLLLEALERLPLLDGLPEVAHVGCARRLRTGACCNRGQSGSDVCDNKCLDEICYNR